MKGEKDLTVRFLADTNNIRKGINLVKREINDIEKKATVMNKNMGKGITGIMDATGHKINGLTGHFKTQIPVIASANKGFKKLSMSAKEANQAMGGLSTMFGGVAYRLMGFKRVLQAIPGSLKAVAAGAAAVAYSFNRMWKHGMNAESSIITMTTLLNSQQRALELYEHALRFAGRTPFDPSDVGAASGRAVQYGIQQPFEKAFKGIGKAYSSMDIFSALGSFTDSSNRMIGISRAMQAIMTGNLKMARGFRGIIGKAWDDTKKVAKVGSAMWGKTLLANIAKIPNVLELATKRADSMVGAWSTIKGYAAEFWIYMSGVSKPGTWSFWYEIKSIILDVRDGLRVFLDESRSFIESIGLGIGGVFQLIWEVLGGIWEVIGPLTKLIWHLVTGAIAILIKTLVAFFRILGSVIKGVWNVFKWLTGWSRSMKGFAEITKNLLIFIQDAMTYLEIYTMFAIKALEYFFQQWIRMWDQMFDYANRKLEIMIRKAKIFVLELVPGNAFKKQISKLHKEIEFLEKGGKVKNVAGAYVGSKLGMTPDQINATDYNKKKLLKDVEKGKVNLDARGIYNNLPGFKGTDSGMNDALIRDAAKRTARDRANAKKGSVFQQNINNINNTNNYIVDKEVNKTNAEKVKSFISVGRVK